MNTITAAIDVLSEQEKELIHRKSCRLLEEVGIYAPCRSFLKLMEENGAVIDYDREIFFLPEGLTQSLLEEGRARHNTNYTLEPLSGYVSTEVYMVDYRTRTRRPGTVDDIMKGIALLNHLSAFPGANAIVVPSDVPACVSDVVSFQKLLTYSEKPGGTYILSKDSAEYIIRLAQAAGKEISYDFQTVSPFRYSADTLELAMFFHDRGLKATASPFVMSMGSGPVTTAGALLVQNTEYLACMFVSNVLAGRTIEYSVSIHPMDPGTLICSFGAPGLSMSALAGCSMARYYGLTCGGNVGLTDSLDPDFQAGFEKGISAAFSAFSGGKFVGCQGIVGADQGNSLEQLVIDNEWLEAFNFSIRGIPVNEETLAEDLIRELGIGGSFISEEHTIEHLREYHWQPSVFHRGPWSDNSKTLLERAEDKVREYTRGYQTAAPIVPDDTARELQKIAEEALKELPDKR